MGDMCPPSSTPVKAGGHLKHMAVKDYLQPRNDLLSLGKKLPVTISVALFMLGLPFRHKIYKTFGMTRQLQKLYLFAVL